MEKLARDQESVPCYRKMIFFFFKSGNVSEMPRAKKKSSKRSDS